MAVGTGIGFDISQLDAAIKSADETLKTLGKTGKSTAKQLDEAFALAKSGNIQDFISVIDRLSNSLGKKGYNQAAQMVREIASETTGAIDRVNRFASLMQTISEGGRSSVKNGAIESLKYQLDEALSRLGVLNERLQFYTKGEGAKAVNANVVNTSALQDEANKLRVVVELLQRRLEHEQALAALKQRSGAIENQQALNASWQKMEEERTKQLQQQSINAKEANKAYEQAYNDRYQMYAVMYDKMWQEDLKHFERQNANAKSGGQQYAKDYEERTRYYERWINEEFLKEQEKNKRIAESKLAEERRINQQISQDRIDQLGRESQQRQKIEQMIRDTQKRNHDAREKELNDLFREQERQLKAQAKYDSISRRERYKAYTTSYEGAIRTSDRAKTLAQEIQAIKNLEAARAKLNKTDADYDAKLRDINNRIAEHNRNVDQATGRAKKLEQQHQRNANQMVTLQSLAGSVGRALAGMFGIQAVRGYVNKLIEVRGEFELQHKSLQVLIGDIDKANELWDKTVALAVKSPFRVKDLVTYTKQLAAYRVEADKLYDTNKMLADVSAGLGVDMNRLILAFGQVKAANFLRGTELRQFSEAGVNMLEELSKRYTELEGRMVSVGEVFERVSKRMVSFSDVEAVFETITSEGGAFYRMQEKQSETLRGMIMNLKDSIDLMFNEIGESNEGLLKGAIGRVRDLVDNWQRFVTVLQEVGVAFVAMKIPAIAKALGSLGTSAYFTSVNKTKAGLSTTLFGTTIKRLTVGITSLTRALLKNPLFVGGAVAAGLLVVIHQFMRHNKEVAELNKKYDELSVRESNRLKKLDDLAEKANAYNKSIEESEEILSKSAKGTEEYANAEKKLADARSSNQQLLDTIKKDYPQIYDSIKKNADGTIDLNAAIEAQNKLLVANIALNEQAKGGTFFDDVATNAKEATVALVNQYNAFEAFKNAVVSKETNLIGLREVGKISEEQFEKLNGYLKQLSSVQSASEVNTILGAMAEELRGNRDAFNSIIKPIENAKNAWAGFGLAAATTWDDLKGNLDRMYPSLMHFVNTAKQFTPDTWQQEAARNISASLDAFGIVDENLLAKVRNYIESMEGIGELTWELPKPEYTEADLKDWRKVIWDAIKDVNKSLGDDLGQNKVVISLQDMIELDKENIFKNLSEQVSTAAKNIDDTIEAGLIPTQERFSQAQLDAAKSTKPLIKSLSDLLAIIEKSSGGSGKDEVFEKLKNRINLIKEMNKEYEKLNKTFSKAESLAKVQKAYADTAKELGLDTSTMDFTDEGTIKSLEALLGKPEYAANKYVIELQKALDNFKVELGVEVKQEKDKDLKAQVQELFDQYDLSLELKKLNIPKDLAKSLFDVDYLDLDGLKKAVQDQEAKFIGTDMEDEYKKFLEKIDDMEDKAAKERMKTYVKYLQEGMSERVKLKIEELRKLKEIEESDEFTPEQKERIKAGVSKEAKKAQDKQEWEDFKGTEMYTMMFEDLEFLGTKALGVLQKKLEDLKGSLSDLDASEVKEIIGQINKIEDVMIGRNPFKYMNALKDKLKNMKSEEEYQIDLINAQKQEEDAQSVIDAIHTVQQAKVELGEVEAYKSVDKETLQTYLKMSAEAIKQGRTLEDIVKDKEAIVKTSQKEGQIAAQGLNTYKKVDKTLEQQISSWQEIGGKINEVFDASKELMTTLGTDSDGVTMSLIESGQAMTSLIVSAIIFGKQMKVLGYESNMALGVIGWVAIGVQAVATALSAIFSAKDKALQKTVEDNLATVERLQKTYDKLEESIDDAWSTTSIRQYNAELKATTQSMINAQKAAIKAQEQRKGADKEGSDEWKELQEMKAELSELQTQLDESLANSFSKVTDGILDSVHDAAREFTDAWWDAFVETGDGLKGLEENFNEMFLNLAKNQAAMQITGAFADRWKKDLEKYINEDDTELTKDEARKWAEEVRRTFPQLSDALEGYLGVFKDMASEAQGAGLSALQKGVTNITEQTAEVIEALLNSMRFYVADSNTELKNQTKYLRDIHNLLSDAMSNSARAFSTKLV